MNRPELLSRLHDVVTTDRTVVVDEDFVLTHKNWDSMAILTALLAIEEVAGLQMNGDPLAECHRMGEVLDIVEAEWRKANGPAAAQA